MQPPYWTLVAETHSDMSSHDQHPLKCEWLHLMRQTGHSETTCLCFSTISYCNIVFVAFCFKNLESTTSDVRNPSLILSWQFIILTKKQYVKYLYTFVCRLSVLQHTCMRVYIYQDCCECACHSLTMYSSVSQPEFPRMSLGVPREIVKSIRKNF